MIVKNESHIINGTLEHLLTVFPITYWVIDDTGSTDGTQDIIRNFFASKDISGELYETPWRDFGWNRTQAFAHAYNKTDYVLVWDADDSVVGTIQLPRPLTAEGYKLTFGNNSGFRYHRLQLFNNRRRWRYVGVLHEYPTTAEGEGPVKEETILGDYYCESGRTGARSKDPQKYRRDAEVLERGLAEEPDNARYAFYCANSYKDANMKEKAIEMYKRVLKMNGWAEEKYLACVRIWELSGGAVENLPYLIESHNHVSERLEGIKLLIEYYCLKQQDRVAVGFYRFIQDYYENRYLADRPNISRHLFVSRSVYDYDLPYFTIISAIRCGEKQLAVRLFDMIFRCGHTDVSTFHSNSLFFNLQFVFSELTPSLEFLQRLLAYREALPHILETRSEKVIEEVIQLHRPLLTATVPPRLVIQTPADGPAILCTITTCRRLDLFTQTINSMMRTWKDFDRITDFLCVDDNSSEEDRATMQRLYPFLKFHFKGPTEKGHRQSMNLIWDYLQLTRPDYWIHLEDDWLFHRERNYVGDAISFLERHRAEKIDQILFNRNYAELQTGWSINGGIPLEKGYLLHEKSDTVVGRNCGYWPHYSFRPSMTRVSTILTLGNYDSPNTFFEMDYAKRWFAAGYRSAFFDTITCTHIGKLTSDRTGQNAYTLNGVKQFGDVEQSSGGAVGVANKARRLVINLERRPDRRTEVDRAFVAAGLSGEYTYFTAVDGEKLTTTPEIQHLFTGNDFGSRAGVIGCALSHYRIWQQLAADSTAEFYTVFEDDITLADNFREKLLALETTTNMDVLLLGRSIFSNHPADDPSGSVSVLPLDKSTLAGGTFGYIIRKTGAQKLLNYIESNGICHGIDYLFKIQSESFKSQMVVPPIVRSDWVRSHDSNVDSDIQKNFRTLDLHTTSDGWTFHQGLDHMGDDIQCVGRKNPNECVQSAMANTRCVAFNTFGYLKHSYKTPLTKSPWFSRRDGIWTRESTQEQHKIRIKMLCNWCSSRNLCNELNKMTQGNYCWNNLELTWKDNDIDYWVILNKPGIDAGYFDPARTLVFQLEPWCGDASQTWGVTSWGVKTWGEWARPDPAKFLYVHTGPTPVFWQGTKTYTDYLTTYPPASCIKQNAIAHIASAKYVDPGHKLRIDFLRFLEEKGDIPLAIYGKENYHGFKSYKGPVIDDRKEDIIAGNKYYFMCENNFEENYITEKLWEPILCESLCFYIGAPNVASVVSPDAFVELNLTNFEEAYTRIKAGMTADEATKRLPAIRAEKQKILREFNLMAQIESIILTNNHKPT